MEVQDVDQHLRDIQREYLDFLDDAEDQGKYTDLVKEMVTNKSRRLVVNINDLRRKNPTRAQQLLCNSFEEQLGFQRALKEYVFTVSNDANNDDGDYFVAFEGSFGSKHVTPRTLHSRFLGNMVCVEGIVTKCSLINPKVVRSAHYCPATNKAMERKYTDFTSFEAFPTSAVYPTKDDDGNLLETDFGYSVYKDHQTVSIQEMPEKAPAGQLPRSVDIICDNDLVDSCKPGDRIQVVGSYRCLPSKYGGYTPGTFRTIVIANNVSQLSKESTPSITREDVTLCKRLSKKHKGGIFDLLAKSLAPSIHGHEYIKKAILCLLLGGVEKVLPNQTRLRGDINVLLIGDPSVAKSQLLRYVLCTAPRAIATTGRGSTGVGLTAAVTTDQETGERRLEAGAMVLADRGVVCIDEFDKMTDIDRTAIHEVMEQGRVTISKAGIHASLNARCSVLAAANPLYGKYDQYKTPMENINMQDSLLSRFDLLFVMLDTIDEDHDNMIADHVVRMHRYRSPLEQDGEVLPMGSAADVLSTQNPNFDEDETKDIFEMYDPLLHGGSRKRTDKILTVDFMRKYIYLTKILKPVLTEESSKIIADEYAKLRSEDMMDNNVARTQPVTARTLETMIRLATAHAKARMSSKIEEEDANMAIELLQYAYFKKVLEKEKRKRHRHSTEGWSSEEEIDQRPKRTRIRTEDQGGDSGEEEIISQSSTRSRRTRETADDDIAPLPATQEEPMEVDWERVELSDERMALFRTSLMNLFRSSRAEQLSLTKVREQINAEHGLQAFTDSEIMTALTTMSDANKIMLADNIVILI